MNYSLYINQLKTNPTSMWLDSLGRSSEKSYQRAMSDQVEIEFWKEHSKVYDKLPSLYTYAPEVFDEIIGIIGADQEVIELGAGTGQFTIPMSKIQQSVVAVDYSKDMLNILDGKLGGTDNVRLLNSKIEALEGLKADVIFGVNCIYRIKDIKSCVENLMSMAKKKNTVCMDHAKKYV